MSDISNNLIEIKNLSVDYYTDKGIVRALDKVKLDIYYGETLGLVGETGCGKSTLALSILRLIQWPPGKILEGQINLEGDDLLSKSESEMRKIRGKLISLVFQDPTASLNPCYTIGYQLTEAIQIHQNQKKKEALEKAVDLLELVAMPDPEKVLKKYPHELSGGMRQRVVIAIALSFEPKLLIADEPTSSLDVTVQRQILELVMNIKKKSNMSVLYITHDLGIVAETCDRVAVMYAGNVVECADAKDLYKNPLHPYTQGLLNSLQMPIRRARTLYMINGSVPDLLNLPEGCIFNPRCPSAMKICSSQKPDISTINNRMVSCFLYDKHL